MFLRPYRTLFAAVVTLAAVAVPGPSPAAAGGPISDMIGRYKMQRQMKIPPMDRPFSGKPVKDISPSNLTSRFKKRFSNRPSGTSITSRGGLFAPKEDSGVARTSR